MNHSINPRSNADERSQLEDEFARQHASDTDEQLLSYVGSIASKPRPKTHKRRNYRLSLHKVTTRQLARHHGQTRAAWAEVGTAGTRKTLNSW